MKKIFALLLAAIMIFALCACSQTAQQTETTNVQQITQQAVVQPVAVETVAAAADPSSVVSQLNLIYSNFNQLKLDDGSTQYWYTVADLDHNGRLELIAAVTQGTGSYTTGKIYEVNSAYSGFQEVNLGGQYLPEIIVMTTETFKDSSNNYYYIYTDTEGSSANESKVSMTLNNGVITQKKLASKTIEIINGTQVVSFIDQNGMSVSDPYSFDYAKIADTVYSNATKSSTSFDWFLAADATEARFVTSYNAFNGSSQPVTQTAVVTTATPQPTITIVDVPTPTITKNPTGENPIVGGQCIFVAHANAYQSVKWQLISTTGGVYDLTNSNPFPGMGISGSSNTQLVLSNVPLELNGWSVRAAFTGTRDTVYTSQAYIYVSSATTISFSPSSGFWFNATNNYIQVFSSSGQNVKVECIQSGNTGPYYSETVSSGAYIPITGISGQVVTVSVYASSGNTQTQAYYTVDCTPIQPIITPDPYDPPTPTYEPTQTSKSGYIDWVNDYDGCYYVGVTFDDGSGGNYDISYMVSNPPSGGERCTCTFASDGFSLIGFSYY